MTITCALWQAVPTLLSVGTPFHTGCTRKKKDIFDPIEDDDDIDWKHNPFDVDSVDGSEEIPEQLMSQITFEGSPQLQTNSRHWFENS